MTVTSVDFPGTVIICYITVLSVDVPVTVIQLYM